MHTSIYILSSFGSFPFLQTFPLKELFFSITIFIFCVFSELNAQSISFISLNGPYGGNLGDVVFTTDGNIFVSAYYSESKGIYKSTDTGLSWQLLPPIYPYNEFFALGIDQDNILFAGTSGAGLYRSTDMGESWNRLQDYISPECWAIAFNDSGHIFAGDGDWGGLYKSTDIGDTWNPILPTSDKILAIEIDSNGNIYVGTSNNFYKSTDNGETFTSNSTGLPNSEVAAVLTNTQNEIFVGTGYISQGDGIYFSNDGGANWVQIGLASQTVYSLTIDQSGNIYAGTQQNGVYKSTDNGNTWEMINNGLQNQNIFRVTMSPSNLLFVCSETDGGIYRSVNFGESWEVVGVTAGTVNRGIISESGDIYTATYNGVQYYNSGTDQWSILGLTSVSLVRGLDWLSDIIIDNDGVLFAGSWAGDVFKSSDNGITWDITMNVDTVPTHVVDMALYPDNSVLLGIYGYIKRSADKGSSWTTIINGLPNSIIDNIAINDQGIVYAVSQDKLCRASHIDSLFIVIKDSIYSASPPVYNRLVVGSDGLILLASQIADSGIYRSTNYGDSWSKVNDKSIASLSLFNNKYVIAGLGSGQGVLLSSDLGDTWFRINEGIPSESYVTWNQIDTDGYLYAAVAGRGLYKTNSVVTNIIEDPIHDVNNFVLNQNYPNPFNSSTFIQWQLAVQSYVQIKIFDVLGREVTVLINEEMNEGTHSIIFNAEGIGKELTSGVYFYRLETIDISANSGNSFTQTRKMLYLK